jgi:hypothetical protein
MPDEPSPHDPRVIWKEQPGEAIPVIVGRIVHRRTRQLHLSTRSEIVMSIVAALFSVAVLVWRLPPAGLPLQPIGLAAAGLWIMITVIRFRHVIWGSGARADAATTGLAYYRRELEIRRDLLRNAWLWHGPLLLAAFLFLASLAGRTFPSMDRFRNTSPILLILAVWIVLSIRRRLRQAAEIQCEIDEIARLEERK